MSLFGSASGFGTGGTSMFGSTTTDNHNPMKDIEVTSSPDDSIGCLSFSPPTLPGNFLIAGSWANDVRCWEVQDSGQTIPKAQQMHTGPVLDVCWSDDGSKVFTASCDKTAKMWDLNSNQAIQIAQHDAPVKTIHWIKAPNYSCGFSFTPYLVFCSQSKQQDRRTHPHLIPHVPACSGERHYELGAGVLGSSCTGITDILRDIRQSLCSLWASVSPPQIIKIIP